MLKPAHPSVWLTGQTCSRDQRRSRYTRGSLAHPGKMLPALARQAIATWTDPGEIVLDPMAGIGTSVIEAMHLGRHGIGIEYEARWAHHAANNIALSRHRGATGTGRIWRGDSRNLSALIPDDVRGRVALVITSPPYGASTHGQVRTPGPKAGKIRKVDHRYGADPANLAYLDHEELCEGFTVILAQSAKLLRDDGTVMVTARPIRHGRELIDIPGMAIAAGIAAGLTLTERCVALIPAIRNGRLVSRASFFQKHNVRVANATGDPHWLIGHEDVLTFRRQPQPNTSRGDS